MTESEVIIVGGGPAGSACAWRLKHSGRSVLILDKEEFPRLKLCAGWITPKVLINLKLDPKEYPHSLLTFRKLIFHFYGKKLPIRTHQFSIRRHEFDLWLLKRSEADFHKHRVSQIIKSNGLYVIDDLYRCKYLVGAGGTYCPVYLNFFREISPRKQSLLITSMEEEFVYESQDENCYLWFFDNKLPGYSWYVPKGNGYTNVGIGGNFSALRDRKETIKDHWNLFIKKLGEKGLIQNHLFRPQGYHYYHQEKNPVGQRGKTFIIGDAAGLATKDMGEGIGPAIESGLLAADAIINGTPYNPSSISRYSFKNILFPRYKKVSKKAPC
jgi:flavin-dependent dehydrogenase